MIITKNTIVSFNENLKYESPKEIINFILSIASNPIVTTSFGKYSSSLLYAVTSQKKNVPVVWCDTGYNTEATYKHASRLIQDLKLNVDIFSPQYSTAFINYTLGSPTYDNPKHQEFSEVVKLEPFKRALEKYKPDIWFTNIRQKQTEHRSTLDILSFSETGILKVSPFFYFSDQELEAYCKKHNLPIEGNYFDPVKAMSHRECGIHFQ
ncbi:phosphoadenosine phosphosulfate reductase family protein [Patiriisocius hiemis]|uniref:Phosphoadenosine phosphosulfate reductase family protein n=1 Tax=Patiriisocius hiemis TaxID=3075604 RepID=A0ABU2YDG0_9FLAO|nr:phosphoadenosine phosphosulfate reductase family protein [Constantimarinum sp. W242]MDT0555797.1 phosphoadenosine phosphosulfate reductase family protein [Constantimarinum sp. W242]